MTIASSFPAMVAMAPIIQANLQAVGIKATIGTMEIPRYWDEVWSTSNFDITTMYWLSPARRSGRFRHQQLQVRHGDQRAEVVQRGDGRDPRARPRRRRPRRSARSSTARCRSSRSRRWAIVPLVNGWILIAHTNKLQELPADAHRLPEDAEGRVVRIAGGERRSGAGETRPGGRSRSGHAAPDRVPPARLRPDADRRLDRPVHRDQRGAGLGRQGGARHRRDAAGDRAVRASARPRSTVVRPVSRLARRRAARRLRQLASRTTCRSGRNCSRACR